MAASASFLLELRYEIMGRNERRRILYDHTVANMEGLIYQWGSGKAEEIPNLRAIQYLLAHRFPRVATF